MSARFEILATPIPGLHTINRKPIGDQRGYLERIFCADELQELVAGKCILQINHTYTAACSTVRGMHFQHPPYAETKLVSCLRGEVFDVAVDLRRGSPTWLQWHGEVLSAGNHKTLMIPEGFAHGFQTLTDDCELLYLHTSSFQAEAEGGLHPEDPRLAITWPLPVSGMSPRDAGHPFLTADFTGLTP